MRTTGQTGVEMEALTAASVAALTVYDMCKSVDRGMVISDVRLAPQVGRQVGDVECERPSLRGARATPVARSSSAPTKTRDTGRRLLRPRSCARPAMSKMLSVRDAHARVIAAFDKLPAEMVSLADAAGRVLATPPRHG